MDLQGGNSTHARGQIKALVRTPSQLRSCVGVCSLDSCVIPTRARLRSGNVRSAEHKENCATAPLFKTAASISAAQSGSVRIATLKSTLRPAKGYGGQFPLKPHFYAMMTDVFPLASRLSDLDHVRCFSHIGASCPQCPPALPGPNQRPIAQPARQRKEKPWRAYRGMEARNPAE
jgi:hypothetical protein